MSFIAEVFKTVAAQIELVMGIVVLIGLLALKKKPADILKGTIKAIIGVLVLKQGSGILLGAYRPVMGMINDAYNIAGVVTENYGGMAAIQEAVSPAVLALIPQVMILGFAINVLLARFTNLKYVFLTAHTMFAFATLAVWLNLFFFGVEGTILLFASSVMCGVYWTVMPAWVHRYSQAFNDDNFTVGHISGFAAIISAIIGRKIGKYDPKNPKIFDEQDEAKKDKGQFAWITNLFSDTTVITALLMSIVLIGGTLLVPFDLVKETAGTTNVYIWMLLLGFNFTVGITVLMFGVRMMIAELVPAFKGISDKLIPNSIPALDMAVFYPLAPFAAILGFIGTFIGEFVGFGVLLVIGNPIIMIPGIIATFFDGGLAGVFGYKYGGRKAAFISGLVVGLIQILGGVIFTGLAGLDKLGATYGNTDFGILWPIVTFIMSVLTNVWFFLGVTVVLYVIANHFLKPKVLSVEN